MMIDWYVFNGYFAYIFLYLIMGPFIIFSFIRNLNVVTVSLEQLIPQKFTNGRRELHEKDIRNYRGDEKC